MLASPLGCPGRLLMQWALGPVSGRPAQLSQNLGPRLDLGRHQILSIANTCCCHLSSVETARGSAIVRLHGEGGGRGRSCMEGRGMLCNIPCGGRTREARGRGSALRP
uniref:Uncharacterized protein n=1 Tax=Tetraselmis sp. GSL018 TaxID=582737 RepID=A0A061RUG3_9CHLO